MTICFFFFLVLLIRDTSAANNTAPIETLVDTLSTDLPLSHIVSSNPTDSMVLFWNANNTAVSFALVGRTNGYVAIGFSPNGRMVGSIAVMGRNDASSGLVVEVRNLTNQNLAGSGALLVSTSAISNQSLMIVGEYLVLQFTWTFTINTGVNWTASTPTNLIFSKSPTGALGYHGLTRWPTVNPITMYPTGQGATPYLVYCRDCLNGGVCNGSLFCQCPLGWTGANCGTAAPTAPAPSPSGGGGLADYTHSLVLFPGLTLYWKPYDGIATTISFAVSGTTTGFVAVGWSDSNCRMKGSDAVIGWTTSGAPNIADYVLPDEATPGPPVNKLGLSNLSAQTINGVTTIFFTRSTNAGNFPISANGTNYLIASHGPSGANPVLTYHGPTDHTQGQTSVNFVSGSAFQAGRTANLRDAHALLMFVSWGVLLTFGMLWARYARGLPDAIWFKVHRVTQYSGYPIALAGWVIAYVMVAVPYHPLQPHHVVGTLIMIFGFIQILVAFFRPHKEKGELLNSRRVAFEYFHWWNGRILIAATVYQVFSGITLVPYPYWVTILYAVLVACVLFTIVVLEIVYFSRRDEDIVPCWKCYHSEEIQ